MLRGIGANSKIQYKALKRLSKLRSVKANASLRVDLYLFRFNKKYSFAVTDDINLAKSLASKKDSVLLCRFDSSKGELDPVIAIKGTATIFNPIENHSLDQKIEQSREDHKTDVRHIRATIAKQKRDPNKRIWYSNSCPV